MYKHIPPIGVLPLRLVAAQDQLRQLHLHVQRVVGPLELQHQDAVGVAEDASKRRKRRWKGRGKSGNPGKTKGNPGKPLENPGKIWENKGKPKENIGKPRETHRKTMI